MTIEKKDVVKGVKAVNAFGTGVIAGGMLIKFVGNVHPVLKVASTLAAILIGTRVSMETNKVVDELADEASELAAKYRKRKGEYSYGD